MSGAEGGAAAVIAAAGEGSRCEGERRKQFRRLAGVPVLARTLEVFSGAPSVGWICVVLPTEVAERPPGWLEGRADRLVAGGATRRASVGRGVAAVPDACDTVLVHDGVRPLLSVELVERVAARAIEGPVTPVLQVTDTVVRVETGGGVEEVLDRSALRRVQTPQGFPAGVLRQVHEAAERRGLEATDDAGLCLQEGHRVATVEGEERNLKLTTVEDFRRAEAWLAAGRTS